MLFKARHTTSLSICGEALHGLVSGWGWNSRRRIITCCGFRPASVEYDRAARFAGETKYPVWKSARLAFDAITSFSASPLRWIAVLGVGICAVAALWVLFVLAQALVNPGSMQKGWASTIAVMVFLGGVQLVSIGLLGQYVLSLIHI